MADHWTAPAPSHMYISRNGNTGCRNIFVVSETNQDLAGSLYILRDDYLLHLEVLLRCLGGNVATI